MSKILLKRLNKHISNSKSFYYPGATLTWKEFRSKLRFYFDLAGKDPSNTKDMVAFVAAYTKLNKLLARRGLYIKAENYYTTFRVLELDNIVAKIKDYDNKAIYSTKARANLAIGFRLHNAKWTPLNDTEIERVSSHIYRTCVTPTTKY
ncbi:MAG: hypothetical protein BV456_04855 [Thermoplasmata archaeon M8B2D]|nr:MAG: hypothetical protein BV456_04855 [Thermoplasmata archaeon M8B2D]